MASRRMVSLKIIDTARFIKMPTSTQNLYFHLIIKADDDGVVEAFNVMRMIGATEDDLKVLVSKGFAVVLNEDLVTFITDWQEHNLIRADRKVDSIYKDLLVQIVPDVKLLKAKTDKCQTNDGQMADKSPHRLGKDRLGEVSIDKDNIDTKPKKKNYADYVNMTEEEYRKLIEEYTEDFIKERIIDLSLWKGSKGKTTKSDYMTLLAWIRKDKQEGRYAPTNKSKNPYNVNGR